jgi:hypothetical protein
MRLKMRPAQILVLDNFARVLDCIISPFSLFKIERSTLSGVLGGTFHYCSLRYRIYYSLVNY